jgi:hypothetical protein
MHRVPDPRQPIVMGLKEKNFLNMHGFEKTATAWFNR